MTKDDVLKLSLDALKELVAQTESRFFCMKHDHVALQNARFAIARLRETLAPIEIEYRLTAASEAKDERQQALDKKAENARELGLDYEPDYKTLWQQMCDRCDELDKELAATDRQVEILSDLLSQLSKQQQSEPVAWRFKTGTFWNREVHWRYVLSLEGTEGWKGLEPLYTTPQQHRWVGLTCEEIQDLMDVVDHYNFPEDLITYTQAKLKEKNS